MQTIRFKEGPGYRLQADIYPATGSKVGSLVYLHGGALIWGSRSSVPPWQVDLYTGQGFDLVSLDYRLAPETKLPQILEDLRDGLDWVRTQGSTQELKTDPLFVTGRSAGGYLALMTGTFANPPDAIVSFCGYGDILADWYTKPSPFYLQKPRLTRGEAAILIDDQPKAEAARERFLFYLYCRQQGTWTTEVSGLSQVTAQAELRTYCPLQQSDATFPPTLLLHGTDDTDVPYEQSLLMEQRLKALGVPSRLITLAGMGHDFDYHRDQPQVQRALTEVVRFLTEQAARKER